MNPTNEQELNEQELDEILSMLGERHIMVEHRLIHVGMPERNGKNIETRNAKQAIIDWHNKQVEEVLTDIWGDRTLDNDDVAERLRLSIAERAKLKEQSDDTR